MEAEEIIRLIHDNKKKTPVKIYLKSKKKIELRHARNFGNETQIFFADWEDVKDELNQYSKDIEDIQIECEQRNSALPLLDIKNINARIEPGAIIRTGVEIGNQAIIMMGAILNIGVSIGEKTMIDMGAVIGGRAMIGKRCHIGANAVIAGVIEPFNAVPVSIADDVIVGANAVILEGIRVESGAVIAAGAIVVHHVEANQVVAGIPARVIKYVDDKTKDKTKIIDLLRSI